MSYENFNKEELLAKISELEQELKASKKYGLVWDKEVVKEEVVQRCETDIPVLTMDESKTIYNKGQNNILIEGDNFHSLTALNMIGQEFVDVIYIDPPYNRGKEDFVYNDKYVDPDDGYKHSKWLNFMEKRLILAKRLLKKDGTIFISLDDHEQAVAKILCDSIFGASHYVTSIPRVTKQQRSAQEKHMDISHDYILCYSYKEDFVHIIERDYGNATIKTDNIGRYIEGDTKAILADKSKGYSKGGDYDFFYNGKLYKPVDKNGVRNRWLWKKERMEAAAKLGILVETPTSLRMQLYLDYKFDDKTNTMVPKDERLIFHTSDFMTKSTYTNSNGSSELKNISTRAFAIFNNPKPVELMKDLLKLAGDTDSVVLDFFAGSGSTGQSVLELNKEDNGKRRFILCTNNEKNICYDVTLPRLKTIITGVREDNSKYSEGLAGSLYFFKTGFIKDNKNSDQAKYNLVEKVDALLCIRENLFVKKERNEYSSHYCNAAEDKHMFIYNDYYNKEKFSKFIEQINSVDGERVVYVFSTSNEVDESLFDGMKDVTVKPIPAKIYEIYKEIAEDIKRG